ncbi:PAS domain-containing protein [Natronomonas salina]|uniref:sensor histidine kinase n=1 Tax=Natronomonas salina TaxID=1710540 RepID=UPI0015B40BB1|nr:histidine kinase N-terminal 7TM domain-containing protein [Natronomonas salina]QLD90590.1 PAS domain-containing protein [Natronomonas salina]
MAVDPTAVQAVYALSSVTALPIGYVVWRHRRTPGALPLLGSICGGWWWSTMAFLTTAVPASPLSDHLSHSIFLGVGVVVASIFLFSLEYTGREHLVNRWTVALLSVHPLAVYAVAVTNPGDLFYAGTTVDPSAPSGVVVEWGPAFWVHTLYSYVLILVGTVFIVGMLYRSRALYRGQVVALLGAVAAPTVANLVSLSGLVSFDTTPVGFVAANALFAVAIVRYQLIDLSPIARDRVLDEITDAVFVVDAQHRLIDLNETGEEFAERVLGSADIVGSTVQALLTAVPEALEGYREIVGSETAQGVELSVLGRHYAVNASPLEDGRGRHVGWLFLVRDVTERKRREAELRRRNDQLDQFASVVSHDLRNPLGIAKGYVELVEETGELELLKEVEEAHRRMDSIIEDVLALAREGEVVTDPEPVDLRGVAERAWRNVDTDGAELHVDDVSISADGDRLTRLLENLFRNATEHGTSDDPAEADRSVVVSVGRCDGGFYVADDGVGIPEEISDRIFESGFSGGDGTGFGLSIVQQIAEAHGWRVSVTEGGDGGARFEFDGVTFPEDG